MCFRKVCVSGSRKRASAAELVHNLASQGLEEVSWSAFAKSNMGLNLTSLCYVCRQDGAAVTIRPDKFVWEGKADSS
jgi:hypothetical protein